MEILETTIKQETQKYSMFFLVFKLLHKPVFALQRIHELFGDYVSIRFNKSNLIFISNPNLIETAYSLETKGLLSRDFMYEAKKILFGDSLVNSRYKLWSQQRKLMQPFFKKQHILAWENIISEETQLMLRKLDQKLDQEKNFSFELRLLVQRILSQVLFGKSHVSHSEELIEVLNTITRGLAPHLIAETIGHGKLKYLFPWRLYELKKGVNKLKNVVAEEIENLDKDNESLVSCLMNAKDKKTDHVMSKELLNDEISALFFAGQDTTVNTLIWFFYLISNNPGAYQTILEEIYQFKDEEMSAAVAYKHEYIQAAINETLRLYPPTTALSLSANQDTNLGNREVLKGDTLILSMLAVHRSSDLWEKPDEFYPEHFYRCEYQRPKFSFFPFGGNQHQCIGKNFAELEMLMVIVSVLRVFSVQSTVKNVKPALSITLKPNKDILVKLTRIAS